MEWSDVTSTPLHLLFLDWKQAFDSIDHNAMLIALKRFGISSRALQIISSLYTGATFFTKGLLGELSQGGVTLRYPTRLSPQPVSIYHGSHCWDLLRKALGPPTDPRIIWNMLMTHY